MTSPQLRLIGRALLVAVLSFLTQLQGSTSWDSSLLKSALVGAVLAGAEYFTPLNATVGVGSASSVPTS